jgi:glycerate kinase
MNDLAATALPTIVIAPDSFKGSLTATEAAQAMADGARQVFGSTVNIVQCPMADGGEGTLDSILSAWGAAAETTLTQDALGRERTARFGISADARIGVIEAAEATGLLTVSDLPLEPLRADTYGVGVLARELLERGVDEILLCIGGSASTDGGTGLLSALGARFLNATGHEVARGGAGLADIITIDTEGLHPRARTVTWRLAVDVTNPLCGSLGAAAVFGPQKGATPSDVRLLDAGLGHLASVIEAHTGIDLRERAGAGSAGGMPATVVPLLGAELVPGSTLVADALNLHELLAGAALVLTGEGSFDSQSLGGKVVQAVAGVAALASGCPVVVIAGRVALTADQTRAAGVSAAFSIAAGPASLAELTQNAAERVRETAAQACALFHVSRAASTAAGTARLHD